MIPAAFDYVRPDTLAEAIQHLVDGGGDAAILAGGQSLVTDLKLRRRRPALIVDIARLGLGEITIGAELRVGAMARQDRVAERSGPWTLLRSVAAAVSDPMVRHRGTVVGAFCEADPVGDWLAAGLALDAVMEVAGPSGTSDVALVDLPRHFAAAGASGGLIAVAVRFPAVGSDERMLYRKVKHTSVGWSVASAALALARPDNGISRARVAVSGALRHPQRLPTLEVALTKIDVRDGTALSTAVDDATQSLAFAGDRYASADYRAHRLRVLLKRTIPEMLEP